ncbi:MAG: DUF4919 domain-containing protein [Bacteroidaceae bacterium]|nr:DUF4919 domain-containing protein [Bacteroidaceae bacterium]
MMEKTFKKVHYPEYEGKYDESIKMRMEMNPESIDVETMRECLYGYTFTKEYAEGEILDELSMDYWRDRRIKRNLLAEAESISDDEDEDFDLEDEEDDFDLEDEEDDFDLDALIGGLDGDKEDAEEDRYERVSPQERLLLEAIDSTGDGLSAKTALCVIAVKQEYEYLERVVKYSSMRVRKQRLADGIDCLTLTDDEDETVDVYFDVSRCFEVEGFY